ncbi:GNAT family N-acetyltransferase [Vibrio sp. HN007]|uniref:GNAT family N-acetyltransferase n=1 Tax=Vibrio iocasae TaxID=3098914 RepID=UPI0035D3F571
MLKNQYENRSMPLTYRAATESDFDFLYQLKVSTMRSAIEQTFGWDESLQHKIHMQEWKEARPMIVERHMRPIGCYLFEKHHDHFYFGRFYIQKKSQGQGIGHQVLRERLQQADNEGLPVKLLHLKSETIGRFYENLGFNISHEDEHFTYRARSPYD